MASSRLVRTVADDGHNLMSSSTDDGRRTGTIVRPATPDRENQRRWHGESSVRVSPSFRRLGNGVDSFHRDETTTLSLSIFFHVIVLLGWHLI